MAAVPQKTLNWLYGVLGREYRDRNRAYSETAQTLSQYPSFAPRTDVYTYENGAPALLLLLVGTIPVPFRTETYRYPITLWVPHAYPYEPPIVYVTPPEDMVVRPGQHVGGDGKVYHHYLAHWRDAWDRSNISEFLSILAGVFAKEPPVKSKQQIVGRSQQQQYDSRPAPPVPPLPLGMQKSQSGTSVPRGSPKPPPPPPKQPTDGRTTAGSLEPQRPNKYDSPALLPPQAGAIPSSSRANGHAPSPAGTPQYNPQRTSSLRNSLTPSELQSTPHQQYPNQQAEPPLSQQYNAPPSIQQSQQRQQQYAILQPSSHNQQPPPPNQQQWGGFPQQVQPQPQAYSHPQPQPPQLQQIYQHQHQQPPKPRPIPQPSLLDSPFDISLPVTTNLPAPPVPRNPEKDALLSTLSTTLTQTLHNSLHQNASALPSLHAQSTALTTTTFTLQTELSHLTALSNLLSANNAILASSLRSADTAIASARARAQKGQVPGVDEVLTAPTVVGKQLYDVVCEERGVEAAIWALQEGFVSGRIGGEVWGRKTRELAREGFRKRWLGRRVGRGLGLEV